PTSFQQKHSKSNMLLNEDKIKPREIKAFKLKIKVTTNILGTPGVPDSIALDSSPETPSGVNSQLNHAASMPTFNNQDQL
ncbi:hypothetical protein CU098_008212, partial [Rhizopus stolonifer]